MPSVLNPYLSFRGTARDAMAFYRTVFGGELTVSTFKEFGASQEPGDDDLVMHARLTTPSGYVLMGSDVPERMPFSPGSAITVSLGGEERDELQGYWAALSEGATVQMPLAASPWGDSFGMLTDRFGTPWMVNIAGSA